MNNYNWTEEQYKALWLSAEHWLDNWTYPVLATIDPESCACCRSWNTSYDCKGCPIALFSNSSNCINTPYVSVTDLLDTLSQKDYALARPEIEAEYAYIIDVIFAGDRDD